MTVRTALGAADEVGSATAFTSHEGVTPVMRALRKEGLARRLATLPRWENSQLVLHAAHGTGNWIGAASALIHGDYIHLSYRDGHPVDKERGSRAYVAGSPLDSGIHFEVQCVIDKEDIGAESLERRLWT